MFNIAPSKILRITLVLESLGKKSLRIEEKVFSGDFDFIFFKALKKRMVK